MSEKVFFIYVQIISQNSTYFKPLPINCYTNNSIFGYTAITYVKTKKTTKHILLTLTYIQSKPSTSIPHLS